MDKILLSDIVTKTRIAIVPLGHSSSTVYQYGIGWDKIIHYSESHHQPFYSEEFNLSVYCTNKKTIR